MKKIRILLADDQTLFRNGLETVLGLEEDLEVVATAENGEKALSLTDAKQPDVILLDIRMPGMNGVDCVKAIKRDYPRIKVLMLTTFNDEEYILEALANGANGYVLKDIEMDRLTEAIRDAFAGKMIIPPGVAEKLAGALTRMKIPDAAVDKLSDFTSRELEIARMMVQGFTNRQISSALYISEGTIRNYISTIYDKIGIHDRTQAVLFFKETGLK